MNWKSPNMEQRTTIIGRTGSGKTQFGAFTLSQMPFNRYPFVLIDYKGDKLLNAIPYVEEIGLNELPRHPGLYMVKPQPETDDEKVEEFLRRVWKREKTGILIDEAYMVPTKGGAYNALLTQGRSKKTPVISCTQRPAWLPRFVFSEASFFAVFHLTDKDDRLKVRRFISEDAGDLTKRLPEYHCYWYEVDADRLMILTPVPDAETILDYFEARLAPKRRFA